MKNPVPKEVRRPQDHRGLEQTSHPAQNPFCLTHHQGKGTLEGRDHPSQAKLMTKWLLCFFPPFPTPALISPVVLNREHAGHYFQCFTSSIFGGEAKISLKNICRAAHDAVPWVIPPFRKQTSVKLRLYTASRLAEQLAAHLAPDFHVSAEKCGSQDPPVVKHLILVDPWGFPLRPTDPNQIRAPPTWVKAVASVLGRSNPLAVLRVAGPWGPGLVQRFRPDFKRKFADFFDDDTISEYIYHCNAQNPSGETAFKSMMESFGWARRPMLERIHLIRKDVPITMIYGANTWIDTSTGEKVKLQRPGSYVRDMEIEGASHHVYADQPHIFNAVVEEICDSVD
ncbi:(Lyso)-N-acylphosphatidylethanolamine lipase isoform X3 [Hippopotamus amphibius kiboko]|uniref:(Lyso)-N-acylphosphatidylethanolamine lipase isoform X3 n=1 Tax=Hippopotamus amphibius kiboko TaxID=575201 RepID=UPI002596E4AA|nr:(Lyso)-N-acylphosphatidylethanolamine lipase isoform X3 [Hippopotamus amphibius kiboko]